MRRLEDCEALVADQVGARPRRSHRRRPRQGAAPRAASRARTVLVRVHSGSGRKPGASSLNSVSEGHVLFISSRSRVYRDPVGQSASRSVGFSKSTVVIGRTGLVTISSLPDPTLSLNTPVYGSVSLSLCSESTYTGRRHCWNEKRGRGPGPRLLRRHCGAAGGAGRGRGRRRERAHRAGPPRAERAGPPFGGVLQLVPRLTPG